MFNKDILESNEKSILRDCKSLGLSHDDVQEILVDKPMHRIFISSSKEADDIRLLIRNMQEMPSEIKKVQKELRSSLTKPHDESLQILNEYSQLQSKMTDVIKSMWLDLEYEPEFYSKVLGTLSNLITTASQLASTMLLPNIEMLRRSISKILISLGRYTLDSSCLA